MQRNTPEQHREAVDKWRATAPKDDSEIFHEISKKSKSPRHGSLADQLAPLLQWMRRPEGLLPGEEVPPAPTVNTNWSVVADNDNMPPKGFRVEAAIEITPSIEELERAMGGVEFAYRKEPQILKGGRLEKLRAKREVHAYPIGGDYEKRNGIVVRLGRLRFSDGSSYEKGYKTSGDKVVKTYIALPAGSLIGGGDKAQTKLGGGDDPAEVRVSNQYFAELFGVKLTPYRAARLKRPAKKTWNGAVSFTKCPPGLPRGANRIADSFLGMKKISCSGNGSQAWEDICTAIVNREIWAEAVAALPKKDVYVLERAMKAESIADLARGGHKRTEERRGRRLLLAANDKLAVALKKSA